MPPRRKSTDQIRRRPSGAVKTEEKVITPQERRRSFLIQAGVWFLVIAFCMTSGIMCFSIGGQEKQVAEQQAAEQADPVQAEIDRWTNLVSSNPNDAVALANLGYYWTQKADTLPENVTGEEGKDGDKDGKPAVSRAQALASAEEYLDRAVKADPNYAFAIQKLAELRILQKKNDEAKSLYEQVITLSDQPVAEDEDKETIEAQRSNQRCQARMGLAALYMLEKNFDAACGEIDKVLAEQPGSMEAFMLKANALAGKEDTPAMLQCCDEAIKVAESMKDLMNLVSFRVRKSKAYQEMNDKESARRELEEAKKYVEGINPQLSAGISAMINELDGKKPGEAKEEEKAADSQPAEKAEENASQPEAQPSDNNEQPAPEANNEPAPEPPAEQPAPEEGK
ncbi:MAG: hypothetical protein K6G50_03910 [bacterium]|nr:hypothetical protein [bacterium]